MLSREERKEMLEDAKSRRRREFFRLGQVKYETIGSLDEYISFLDSVQKVFSPFKTLTYHTITKNNKL